jgi:hypothetical protein
MTSSPSGGGATSDTAIVSAVIHPAIGIARVGNAPAGHVVGPEVTEPPPLPAEAYRDAQGRLLPQAARFRIYGCNAKGEIVQELTAPGTRADICWTTHLANKKAAWYTFQLALDIPEAAAAPATTLRNPTVSDRAALVLDAGARSLHVGQHAQALDLIGGRFLHQGAPIHLGRMWTEGDARLLVTGGRGVSASANGSLAITFANNEGWHDDVSDGPVTATVTLDGVALPVTPAWLVVAPPDYGPRCKSVRTMWDLMRDVAVTAKMLAAPAKPSFTQDIFPVFARLTRLQWVNAGFAAGFGWDSAFDFTRPDWIAHLRDASTANAERRRVLRNSFRHDTVDGWSPMPWPWVYGDAMNIPTPQSDRAFTQLTSLQLAMLDQWMNGDFIDDWDNRTTHTHIEAVPLAAQGDMLTQAALEFCLADAFHPGCEMTWPVRVVTMYMAPFRFAHAPAGWVEPQFGAELTSGIITTTDGPLFGQVPGGITRWMALPWQTDTASCQSGYEKSYDPYLPTFWPARVPNQVLTREGYAVVMDAERTDADRMAAFAKRASWLEPLGNGNYVDQINAMIRGFDHLGVVTALPGPTDPEGSKLFPPVIQVEDQHRPVPPVSTPGGLRSTSLAGPHHGLGDLAGIDKVHRFPHGLRR